MSQKRIDALIEIGKLRESAVMMYVTGDRTGLETQIAGDVISIFANQLDKLKNHKRLTLVLYTRGGHTLAAWNLVNMIKEYVNEFEVIVLEKALSAGTLISLGADTIIMSNQATLGPIDPSLTTPLNPVSNGINPPQHVPISVEDVSAYMNYVKKGYGVSKGKDLSRIYLQLSTSINPIVIGRVYRSKQQIQMLAKKLLNMHQKKESIFKIRKIVKFLCSDSGSHDYTINRTEATSMGLPVEKPSKELYKLIDLLYNEVVNDMLLRTPYNPKNEIGRGVIKHYSFSRVIIESDFGGTNEYITEGDLRLLDASGNQITINPAGQFSSTPSQINDTKVFDGWRKTR